MQFRRVASAWFAAVAAIETAVSQTTVLDQVSPFTAFQSNALFSSTPTTDVYQAQVKVGLAGPLEGFQLMLEGPVGAALFVRVRSGPGWNTGPIVFQTMVTKQSAQPELVFVDVQAAQLVFTAGAKFVIELQGDGSGCQFRGTYVPPPTGAALYSEPIFLNGPGCFSDCGARIGFSTYVGTPPQPEVYCTSGSSSTGCAASITATANPRVAHNTTCIVTVAGVEGQRAGILFYGLLALTQPWCVSSPGTSFLCVKPPTQRTHIGNSGGVIGQCNGALTLDWNAFQLSQPLALGAPWLAGERAFVQAWFRDPPSCKSTSLSNAIELTYLP